MTDIGCFKEMECYTDNGSIKNFIVDEVDYSKEKVINYLKNQKKIAGCPRPAIDCVTGDIISPSFSVYTDGEFRWCDFLLYHIEKYNISLPKSLLVKIGN